jgi:glycosyltransferase involved in cell wall biosynthesis
MPGGRFGPFSLDIEIAMRYFYPKVRNIIAISRYLQRYFESKGCNVLYLPAILDVLGVTPDLEPRSDCSPLRLAYTGTPGKKDLLDPMLEAILRLDPEGKRIRFTLAGPSLGYLLDLPALKKRGMRQLPACLVAPGYVTHQEAIAIVREADFSVLLRPRQRYAMAGFPSKVPESLAVGTPIICNLTSDLGDFLVDGVNALICDAPTVDACCLALGRALSQVPPERAAMRAMARKLAETAFDYRLFAGPMREFMQRLELVNGSRHSVRDRRGA